MTFGDMSRHQIPGAIGALLFVTDEPVSAMTLADMNLKNPPSSNL